MKIDKVQAIDRAIVAGLAHAAKHGLGKPADIASAIRIELDRAGLTFTWKPGVRQAEKPKVYSLATFLEATGIEPIFETCIGGTSTVHLADGSALDETGMRSYLWQLVDFDARTMKDVVVLTSKPLGKAGQ